MRVQRYCFFLIYASVRRTCIRQKYVLVHTYSLIIRELRFLNSKKKYVKYGCKKYDFWGNLHNLPMPRGVAAVRLGRFLPHSLCTFAPALGKHPPKVVQNDHLLFRIYGRTPSPSYQRHQATLLSTDYHRRHAIYGSIRGSWVSILPVCGANSANNCRSKLEVVKTTTIVPLKSSTFVVGNGSARRSHDSGRYFS